MKAIVTRYHSPGNVRGARISASDGNGHRVIISYDHASDNPHADAAIMLCERMGWEGDLIEGATKDGNVYVFADSTRIANPTQDKRRSA
jgi:hypothetical protein